MSSVNIRQLNFKIKELNKTISNLKIEIKKLKNDKIEIQEKISQFDNEEQNKLLKIIEKKKVDISADPRSLKNLNNTLLRLNKEQRLVKDSLEDINLLLVQKENLIKTYRKDIKKLEETIDKEKLNRKKERYKKKEEERKKKEEELKKKEEVQKKKITIYKIVKNIYIDNKLNKIILNYFDNILIDNIFNDLQKVNDLESYLEKGIYDGYENTEICYLYSNYIDSILMLTNILYEEKLIEQNNVYLVWILLLKVYSMNIVKKIEKEYGIYKDIDIMIESIVESYSEQLNSNKCNIIIDICYYYLVKKKVVITSKQLICCYDLIAAKFNKYMQIVNKKNKKEQFRNKLLLDYENKNYTIDDIDLMSGLEFEIFLKKLFESKKYKAIVTKSTGDQGIDIIIEKRGQKIGIQAKRYSNSIGNAAIQQAIAGKAYYKLDKVVVITNNYYTKSAIELAEANDVILWDRNILKEKL